MGGLPEPDIFVRILNKVEQIDVIAADVREIKNVVRGHTLTLAEHTQTLAEHTKTLAEHTQTLAKHTVGIEQLNVAVLDVHHDVKGHSRDISDLKSRIA